MASTLCPKCWATLRVGEGYEHILACQEETDIADRPDNYRETVVLTNDEAARALKHLRIVKVKDLTDRDKEALRSVSNRHFDSDVISKTDLARIGDILKRVYGRKKE